MLSRQGVVHFRVRGTRGKIRFVPVHTMAQRLIEGVPGRRRPRRRYRRPRVSPGDEQPHGQSRPPLPPGSVYHNIVLKYGRATGISAEVNGLCVHSLRATAATNALSHEADIAKVQEARPRQRCPRPGYMTWCARRTARRSG